MTSGQIALQNYFHKKRARALSLSLIGPALCAFVFAVIGLVIFCIICQLFYLSFLSQRKLSKCILEVESCRIVN